MLEYLKTIYEGATEISPKDAIGALMFGFLVALACSGLCVLLQKRIANSLPLLCGLIFLAIAGSMVFVVGHSRYRLTVGASQDGWGVSSISVPPVWAHHPSMPPPLGWQLLHQADADRNGQLTPEEAAQFVRNADTTGKGWADVSDINHAQRINIGVPSIHGRPTASVPGDENRDRRSILE